LKRITGVAVFSSLAVFLAVQLGHSLVSRAAKSNQGYRWVRAVETGKPGWPRWVNPVVGPEGKLWMIAADGAWSSSDGVNWAVAGHNATAASRYGVASAFFDKKLWLMGGMKNWAEFTNEVSCSTDGTRWTTVNPSAQWGPRRNAMTVVFAGKLWLLGGQVSSGKRDQTPTSEYHDVWNTTDGVTWHEVTKNAPWRTGEAVVFNNRIWIVGNGEAWSSLDGLVWMRVSQNVAALRRGGNGCTVFDGKIWIYGGVPDQKAVNDVWNSADGVEWNLVTEHAPWFPRGAGYSVAYRDKLWIFGGKTGVDYKQADDIWYMTK
jgi:hypothetical protein